jgi:hypothetical protein
MAPPHARRLTLQFLYGKRRLADRFRISRISSGNRLADGPQNLRASVAESQ